MFDHLLGIVMLGLGLKSPIMPGVVMGDSTENIAPTTTTSNSGSNSGDKKELRTDTRQIMEARKKLVNDAQSGNTKLVKQDTAELHGDLKDRKVDAMNYSADIKEKRAEYEKMTQERRAAFEKEIQGMREKAQTEYKARREAFQTRLKTIKDERKKTVVSTVDSRLTQANTNRTTKMTENLNYLDTAMQKLSDRSTELAKKGIDTAAIDTLITSAKAAITAAKAGVAAQAGKEYVIGVTSENNLKDDVGRATSAFEKDMKATYESAVGARKAVEAVYKAISAQKGNLSTIPATTVSPAVTQVVGTP